MSRGCVLDFRGETLVNGVLAQHTATVVCLCGVVGGAAVMACAVIAVAAHGSAVPSACPYRLAPAPGKVSPSLAVGIPC